MEPLGSGACVRGQDVPEQPPGGDEASPVLGTTESSPSIALARREHGVQPPPQFAWDLPGAEPEMDLVARQLHGREQGHLADVYA
jgi:hypothetical protein